MSIQVPYTLKGFNFFVDGRGYAGRVDEVNLPKLSIKSEEHRAGGMDTPIEIDMGMEKLECDFTLSQFDWDVLNQVGILNAKETAFVFRGALGNDSSPGDVKPVVCTMRGGIRESDPGSAKSGEKTQLKLTVALKYYKLEVGGATVHEIDVMNLKRVINGVDQVEAIRGAIGL